MNTSYPSLPHPDRPDGDTRKLGVEVEFAGLDEHRAAMIFAEATGGVIERGEKGWLCRTKWFGACEFYLDTKYQDDIFELAGERGLEAARLLVPVELVTEPFDPADLAQLDRALAALREGGAKGSGHHVFYGFGVHLNVELRDEDARHIHHIVKAYALLEQYLRDDIDLDLSRRVLPFIAPYPKALIAALVEEPRDDIAAFATLVLSHSASRNHGLDLLPLLAWLAPDVVDHHLGGTKNAARPAYHYRLPECRIDDPNWTLEADWRRWRLVEQVGENPKLLHTLEVEWLAWQEMSPMTRTPWAEVSRSILKGHHEKQG